jgi:hypothetical protein
VCRRDSRVRGLFSSGYFGYIEDERGGNNNLIKSKLAAGSVIPSPRPISDLIVTSAAPPPTAEWRKGECLAKFARPCGVDVGPCGADSYGNGPFQSATSVLVEKYGFQSVQNIALAID